MQTASTSGARTTSRQSSWTRATPNSFATRSPDSLERLATATSSTPGWARSLGRWWSRVLAPAPTKPTRIVWVLIGRHGSTSRRLRRAASQGPPSGLADRASLTGVHHGARRAPGDRFTYPNEVPHGRHVPFTHPRGDRPARGRRPHAARRGARLRALPRRRGLHRQGRARLPPLLQ